MPKQAVHGQTEHFRSRKQYRGCTDFQEGDVLRVYDMEQESSYSVADQLIVMIGKRLAFNRNLK